jgi:hypothetical protein
MFEVAGNELQNLTADLTFTININKKLIMEIIMDGIITNIVVGKKMIAEIIKRKIIEINITLLTFIIRIIA